MKYHTPTRRGLTLDRLNDLLRYEPDTGEFWWRVRPTSNPDMSKPAGTFRAGGYHRIWINGKRYQRSHLSWFTSTGEWPSHALDHISKDKLDDRIENLRLDLYGQNQQHHSHKGGKSGFVGILKRKHKWEVQIRVKSKLLYLGRYSWLQDALAARHAAELKYHGEWKA